MQHYDFTDIFGVNDGQRTVMLKVSQNELRLLYLAAGEYRHQALMNGLDSEDQIVHDTWIHTHNELCKISDTLREAFNKYSK